MQRIAPAREPFSEPVAAWLARTMPPGVPALTLFTTLARDARLFERFTNAGLLDRGHLTLRQRELIIDRTTARCGSEYEWGVHVALFGARAGLDASAQYALVHGSANDPAWDEDECILIETCDARHAGAALGDGLWQRLRAAYTEEAILEIVMLAGFYHTVSFLTNVLQLEPEAFAARFPPRHGAGVKPTA